MRPVEGRLRSGMRLGIGILVLLLLGAAAGTVFQAPMGSAGPSRSLHGADSTPDSSVLAGEATFTPPHSDSGYDANGNGLFDFLLVNVSLNVLVADNFTVYGTLHKDANYTLSVRNQTSAGLPTGPAIVTIWFDGGLINQSGIDGPYAVDLVLVNSTRSVIDFGSHVTQFYSHLAFDPFPAFMTPPHADFGEDTNGNGLFDLLNVDVSIQANVAENFAVLGTLHNGNYTLFLFNPDAAFLPVGPGSIRISFPGAFINESGVDGPYIVDLYLYEGTLGGKFLGLNTTTTQAYSHLAFDARSLVTPIQSSAASTTPMIDGTIASGEWNDSTLVNLTAISGNTLPAYLFVKNSPTMLYMAYDAVGDTTMTPSDAAALAFDTGNDAVASNGHEDQFVQGGYFGNPSDQSHSVYNISSGYWSVQDAPYDPSLPNHAGLASAWGFGTSPALGANHRMYEFAIPLALLNSGPNQTLGFFGGSQFSPGVVDNMTYHYSLWPQWSGGPIPLASYGDLILAGGGVGDTTPPTIAINSPAPGEIIRVNSITVNWSASDAGVGLDHFDLRLDGAAPIRLNANITEYTVSAADGTHTVEVTAYDGANNSALAAVSVTVDTMPPALSITAPVAGAVFATTTVAVAWTASDASSGLDHFNLTVDGGPVIVLGPTEVNRVFTNLSEGSHLVTLVAFDLAGHATTATRSFAVDTTAPTITLSAPVAGYVSTGSVLVTWTASDNHGLARIEVSLDGGAPVTLGATATSTTLNGVSDGPHTIRVRAVDLAGLSAADLVTVTVDTTGPTASLTAPTSGHVFGTNSVQMTWTASDATSGVDHFEVRLDSGTPVSVPAGTTTYAFTSVSDGSHTVALKAFDRAGNTVLVSAAVSVDTTAPTVSIVSPGSDVVVSSSAPSVTWTASDATSGIDHIEVRVDGGTAKTLAAGATSDALNGLSDGAHSVNVTVVDKAGHSTSKTVSFRVDTSFVSPAGPYGIAGLSSIIILIVVVLVAVLLIVRRRRRARPPT